MLFAFRDMLEEQPAKKVWLTALKEFPLIFVLEYIAAVKGVSNMKTTSISPGWYCGPILSGVWLIINSICAWTIVQSPSWNISFWESPFIAILITCFFCGLASFLGARQRKSLREGIQAILLTTLMSGLVFIASSFLLTQFPGTAEFHGTVQFLLLRFSHTSYGIEIFLLLLVAASILFGTLGSIVGMMPFVKKSMV
ncbi:hypothetical protein ccbrp13_46550 [Ktedonobacteria bacterium brp13]|nr:hypothetical protein ccbrp13_46550 [Ktedonobacteria bacterium brp13]